MTAKVTHTHTLTPETCRKQGQFRFHKLQIFITISEYTLHKWEDGLEKSLLISLSPFTTRETATPLVLSTQFSPGRWKPPVELELFIR